MKMQCLILLFLLAAAASASVINNATISGNQLTITGAGFSNSPLTVTFNGKLMPIVTNSATQIVATLSPVPLSGTYRLVVKSGGASATAYVTASDIPGIIAQLVLKGQTAPIPTTTLLTPQSDGLFRISSYGVITVPNSTQGMWDVQLTWTDESGPEICGGGQQGGDIPCVLLGMWTNLTPTRFGVNYSIWYSPNATAVVRLKAGTPLAFAVLADSNFPNVSGTTYDLYFTVEQLM